MHRLLPHWPSPAMVVSLLALLLSLGGTSYAALNLPRNSVGTKQLKRAAVTAAKLHNGAVTATKLAAQSVTNANLAKSSLSIEAGRGLTGGGAVALGGSGTLNVDPAAVQNRVSGTCAPGNAISSINQDGSVGCLLAGARDIGAVFPGTPVSFRSEGLRGWQAVTRIGTGRYCLTPDPSTTDANAGVLVSLGTEGGGEPGFVALAGICSSSPVQFAIDTWDAAGTLSNNVAFTAVIP
jgi:hypothetical protein